jgi:hypothetical protein
VSWFNRFLLGNWSHILDAFLLLTALLYGMQMGEFRVQKAWDAEKQTIAQAQAKQEQHVVNVRQSQLQISQEISREFAKNSKLLADRQPDNHVSRVCNVPTAGGRDLSAVSEASDGVAPARTDPLPSSQGDAVAVSCAQLSKDAAQTTLMLTALQRWYEFQSQAFK